MQKNYMDDYIGENLFYYFQDMRNPLIPRDIELEYKISQSQKAEYILAFNSGEIAPRKTPSSVKIPDFEKLPFQLSSYHLLNFCDKHEFTLDQALCELSNRIQRLDQRMSTISDSELCVLHEETQRLANERKKLKAQNRKHPRLSELRKAICGLYENIASPSLIGFIRHFRYNPNIANIADSNGLVQLQIHIHYFQKFKILLPAFFPKRIGYGSSCYYFNPCYRHSLLFNLYYLSVYPEATVILTDSIELAKNNQTYTEKEQIADIVWVSWYGGVNAVEKVDWSPLVGRKIYYLLKEHSAMGTSQVYKTALKVNQELSSTKYPALTYISLLTDPAINESQSMEISNSPVIWNTSTFKQYALQGYVHIPYNYDVYLDRQRILEHSDSSTVFKPFIFSRSVTLLYGFQSAKTWVAFSIAAAVKHGEKMWDGCEASKPASVLYIHGKMSKPAMLEKLDKMEKQYKTNTSEKVICYSIPEESGDGEHSLRSDIHLIISQINYFQQQYNHPPTLIVLDSLTFIDKLRGKSGRKVDMNSFITNAKILGSAILIVHNTKNTNESGFYAWKKDLAIDVMVKVEKEEPVIPSRIAISMSIRSGLRDLNAQSYQQLEIGLSDDSPQWKLITDKRSKQEEMALINKLLWKGGLDDADIARALNQTIDTVKKRKAELRKDYKDIVIDSFQKQGLLEHQISTRYNIAPQLVAAIIKKASRSKA